MVHLTLEDIARQAGVSRSTVSRVINNHPNVRGDVRAKVLQVIQATGYHPNQAARALASSRSWMMGLVLPRSISVFFADPYYPRLTQGIAQACNQSNYTLALFLVGSKEDEEKIIPRILRKNFLDGVLVQSSQTGDQIIDRLAASEIPQVIIGRPFNPENVSYIDVDNVNSAYNAVSHLIRLGYKRIGTITGSMDSTVSIDRKEGYCKALQERGRELRDDLIAEGDFTEASGYYAMQRLLPSKPDAVFVASDMMAIGAMRAAREAGLSVPDDVAFVGFDDLPISTTYNEHLTTVRQPVHQTGYQAVQVLIDLIENGIHPPRHVIMGTELVVRETCGASRRK